MPPSSTASATSIAICSAKPSGEVSESRATAPRSRSAIVATLT